MATISCPRSTGHEGTSGRLALAVADANWYTTENLFREVQRENVSTLLLKCIDFYNAWRQGQPPWAWGRALHRSGPGPLAARSRAAQRLDEAVPALGDAADRAVDPRTGGSRTRSDSELVLVMTYPHYLYLRDLVRPDRHVYFNIDDYSQYWPRSAGRVNATRTTGGARGRPDGLRLAAPCRGASGGGPRSDRADPPPAARLPLGFAGRARVGPARARARRPRGAAAADPGLCWLARGPGRLDALDSPQRGVPPRIGR